MANTVTKYLDLAGLQRYDELMKALIGTIPEGAAQDNVIAYLEAQIEASEFSGKAEDVTIADAGSLVTATNVEDAIQELAGAIAKLNGDASTVGSVAKAINDKVGELKIGETNYGTVVEYVNAMTVAVKHLIDASTGDISALTTDVKTDLVHAINDVDTKVKAIDFSGKADKVASATAGNFAGLDADGNLTDSGKKADDFEVAGAAKAVQGGDASYTGTVKSVDDKIGVQKAEGVEATGLYKYVDDSIAGADISGKIQTEIEKLDVEDAAVTGQFVTAVSETDGKISVTRAALTAADIPDLTLAKITDAGTAAAKDAATAAIVTDSEDASLVSAAQVATFVKGQIAGLTGVLHFRGTFESLDDVENPANGDVAIVGVKEYIFVKPGEAAGAWKELGDESMYVAKTTTIAGVDLQDNITKDELLTALNVADGAQVNVIEGIKVGDTAVTLTDKIATLGTAAGATIATTDIAYGSADSNLATAAQVAKYVDKRIFVGTEAEFTQAKADGKADEHTFAVITDADESVIESIPTTDIDALFS